MGKALFYHLTRNPLEVTARILLERALQAGWRVTLRGTDDARLDWLDEALWQGEKHGFLPHGRAGGPHDADQPILLTSAPECPNAPDALMLVDSADIHKHEIERLQRAWVLFDGNDPASLARARTQWKALRSAGVQAEYWSEDSGRWEMKARTDA